MIYIRKGPEPRSLMEYRQKPNASYDDYREKTEIRQALLVEQGFLCAYCMKRITIDNMKIEHWYPQNTEDGSGKRYALDYQNMLGVCKGNDTFAYKYQTCDSHKRNSLLTINPLDNYSIEKVAYRYDGSIYSEDLKIDYDLNETLNLNCERSHLKENRKAAIRAMHDYLKRIQNRGLWNAATLQKARQRFQAQEEGRAHEYLGAILYFIQKYLKRVQ